MKGVAKEPDSLRIPTHSPSLRSPKGKVRVWGRGETGRRTDSRWTPGPLYPQSLWFP